MDDEEWIGTVEHYYPRMGAVVVKIDGGDVHVGDKLHFFGHGTDLVEEVRSLQVEHRSVQVAHPGDHAGVRLSFRVPERADVFRVRPTIQQPDFHERYAVAWDPSY
jgi:translation elongation factor EF-1alpha